MLKLKTPLQVCGFWLCLYVVLLFGACAIGYPVLIMIPLTLHLMLCLWGQSRILSWMQQQQKSAIPLARLNPYSEAIEQLDGRLNQLRRQRSRRQKMIRWFRNGAEALPDALMVFQRNQLLLWCNQPAAKLFHFSWPLDGQFYLDQLISSPLLLRYIERGDFSDPLELRSPDCDEQFFEYRVIPYTEDLSILIVRDMTRLHSIEKVRKRFVSNVSHELRTPLTVLKGYLEMGAALPGQQLPAQVLPVMSEQTDRMENLVNDLLTLSRIESDTEIDQSEQVDIPAMMKILEEEALALSGKKNHQFSFEIDPELQVLGNTSQLRSAISNLVYNAVHYTPDGGKIHVRWYRHNKRARFCVEDSGEGIASKHIPRLTERFYRVDKARSRQTGGSGLGLAIVKHALHNHQSQLQIESTQGKGSTFCFTLPAKLVVTQDSEKTTEE
ncbi:phosphate regulon sensor histidine kinase PhoR [Dongshaea marina]|uniref:phosphate regulon sensor histidine kinase PhoR n=1 Tax=Dongshaea marina TaxID=2047966 RepID=UPI000D3E4063|nr:phosphate regulon sensor histidine kinase PhoR [Dongshaea marina]